MEEHYFDVIIFGAGPAGLTSGIYLGRSRMKTLILNEGTVGGQMVLTHEVANYPGIEKISGYQLSRNMRNQAVGFGAVIKSNVKIKSLSLESAIKTVETEGGEIYRSSAVIFATGGRSRSLGVPGEEEFKGRGISYCATCDGDFFQDKEIIVVGGGNSSYL